VAPALHSRFAIGFLVGAALLPAPAALARDHPFTGGVTGAAGAAGTAAGRMIPVARPADDRVGPWAGRRAGEGRLRPGRTPDAAPRPGVAEPSAPAEPSASGRLPATVPPQAGTAPLPPGSAPRSPAMPDPGELEVARPGVPLPYEPEPQELVEREWTEVDEAPADPPSSPVAPDSDSGAADESGARAAAQPTGPVLRVLPLGTGLALMGLGLAYFGFRLRQR
jgi:hypothetical protein